MFYRYESAVPSLAMGITVNNTIAISTHWIASRDVKTQKRSEPDLSPQARQHEVVAIVLNLRTLTKYTPNQGARSSGAAP